MNELSPASEEDGWLSLACRSQANGLCDGCARVRGRGGRWKSQNRKNMYLSPYVEDDLNSKVIKSYVPELRSRYVLFEFQDSYVLCIYMYEHYERFAYPYECVHFTYSYLAMVHYYVQYFTLAHIVFLILVGI